MKAKSIFAMLVIALVAMTACSSNDDDNDTTGLATEEQMDAVSGHWYAELPISGETDNWRTEEEGDKDTFDKVTVIFYLGNSVLPNGWWGFLYLQGDEMVNYGGIDLNLQENQFAYTMTSDGHVMTSSQVENMPKVTNMRYDSSKDIITADVAYNGQSYQFTFTRPANEDWERLNGYFEILLEEGIVGGYDDDGDHLNTDVTSDPATEPQRTRRR